VIASARSFEHALSARDREGMSVGAARELLCG
jgi:hypothetical protein